MLARQFGELMIGVLVAAAIISAAVGEWADGAVILAIVLLNGVLGYVQEERAGRAWRRCGSSPRRRQGWFATASLPTFRRGPGPGRPRRARGWGPRAGGPAAAGGSGLQIDESSLTGESAPADKDATPHSENPDTPLGDRKNMAHTPERW